jgi:predicted phosphoadenosine phosphosulfate sulfurtransferase
MFKKKLNKNVLEAAKERISIAFDKFEKISVSFSGGKDSTVMLHLVMEEAIQRNRKVAVLFIDWECQLTLTIDHVRRMYRMYEAHIEPYWICLPVSTNNSCSMTELMWTAWDEEKKEVWVREKEPMAIKEPFFFPFYFKGILFEEFVELYTHWYGASKLTGFFVGIRAGESLNRLRSIFADKERMDGLSCTTKMSDNCWNVYPIYDWKTEDDWTYLSGKCYNELYDRMYQAGMKLHQMRIDEPFGEQSRRSLWLYQVVEPEMWSKFLLRISGANFGSLYSNERGNIMGYGKIKLPAGHTWKSFSHSILESMPPASSEHYKNKIATYLKHYQAKNMAVLDYSNPLPKDDIPSWYLICRALLRNDYWCTSIGFKITKSANYERYLEIMKRRREKWGII